MDDMGSEGPKQDSYPANISVLPIEEVKLFKDNEIEQTCPEGRNSLFYAVQRKDGAEACELAAFLLNRTSIPKDAQDAYGQTALFYAAREGNLQCLKFLVEEHGFDVSHEDDACQTPLFYAARDGQTEVVRWLCVSGSNINHVDANEDTPILYAARDGREETVKVMLELGADCSYKNPNGLHAAMIARDCKHFSLARMIESHKRKLQVANARASRKTVNSQTTEEAPPPSDSEVTAKASSTTSGRGTKRAGGGRHRATGKRNAKRSKLDSKLLAEDSDGTSEKYPPESAANPNGAGGIRRTTAVSASGARESEPVNVSEGEGVNSDFDESITKRHTAAAASCSPDLRVASPPAAAHSDHEAAASPCVEVLEGEALDKKDSASPIVGVPAEGQEGKRDVYVLQHRNPNGGSWTCVNPFKLEEFEVLFPNVAIWDQSAPMLATGLENDSYRAEWHRLATELMRYLIEEVNDSQIFREPVDPHKWKIPDYFDIVKNPMDFGTIQIKLDVGVEYRCILDFMNDLNQVFANCILYNNSESAIGQISKRVQRKALDYCKKIGLQDMLLAENKQRDESALIVRKVLETTNSTPPEITDDPSTRRLPIMANQPSEEQHDKDDLPLKTDSADQCSSQSTNVGGTEFGPDQLLSSSQSSWCDDTDESLPLPTSHPPPSGATVEGVQPHLLIASQSGPDGKEELNICHQIDPEPHKITSEIFSLG